MNERTYTRNDDKSLFEHRTRNRNVTGNEINKKKIRNKISKYQNSKRNGMEFFSLLAFSVCIIWSGVDWGDWSQQLPSPESTLELFHLLMFYYKCFIYIFTMYIFYCCCYYYCSICNRFLVFQIFYCKRVRAV